SQDRVMRTGPLPDDTRRNTCEACQTLSFSMDPGPMDRRGAPSSSTNRSWDEMNDVLVLPTGPLADASLALVRSTESRPIADHSIRSFIFARFLAEHEGALNDSAYDEDLLFAAAVMHDLGLGEHAEGQARFEVEGADLAAELLRAHGVREADVDRVWEAIALHASHRLAERRGLLTYLTHKGVFIDAGRITDVVADELRKEVHNAYPKPTDGPYIADA